MNKRIDPTTVKGWGIDADPENEPTYPIKKYTGDDHLGLNYERPPQQPVIEHLHSNERPNMTAVYGTSMTPTSGLSGAMRRFAFRYSEDSYKHWLTLVAADRVNVIEGIVADIKRGHIPNIFAESGWKAQWKHAPRKVAVKTGVAVAVTAALIVLLLRKRKA